MDERRLKRVLRQHVKTDQLLGVEAVPVGDGWAGVAVAAEVAEREEAVERADIVKPQASVGAVARSGASAKPQAAALPVIETNGALLTAVKLTPLSRDEKVRLLAELNEGEVRDCKKCALCSARTQTVFGEGDPDADIMFIGEGPGQTEDELGRPFVGKAGDLLDKMIVAMGLERVGVYIANVVKCRPPNNRTPTPLEAEACFNFLRRQIEIIQPKVIVTLGGPAAKTIIGTQEGITRIRGTWQQYAGVSPPIPVMPTFHPAYLLRSYTPDNRKKVWSDLQSVMERLGKPLPKKGGGG